MITNERDRFGDIAESRRDKTLTLVCHVNRPKDRAVRLSETGDDQKASWIPRSLIRAVDPTGKTTRGFNREGQVVDLEIVTVTMVRWKALQEGWL